MRSSCSSFDGALPPLKNEERRDPGSFVLPRISPADSLSSAERAILLEGDNVRGETAVEGDRLPLAVPPLPFLVVIAC